MNISEPRITNQDGEIRLSAQVSFETPLAGKPCEAWFSFPASCGDYLSGQVNPFAVGLLPLAMHTGEELRLEGTLSPRLARGIQEYQMAMNYWLPRQLHRVEIKAERYEAVPDTRSERACVTLFSGGVDSAYTLMSHLPEHQPLLEYQVRYALFLHGFDIPLTYTDTFNTSLETFRQSLASLGVTIIPCRTNLHYFTSGLLSWEMAHGCVLIAAGLALEGLVGNLLIPASCSLEDIVPWGSTPMTDHWLSTETMQTIDHGAPALRIEKLEAITKWEPAWQFLRVCGSQEQHLGVMNCGKCEKCLRTMTMLKVMDALELFATFKPPFRVWDVLCWVPTVGKKMVYYQPQTLRMARQRGKRGLVLALLWVGCVGNVYRILKGMVPEPLFLWLKRRMYPYEKSVYHPKRLD